MLRIVLPLLMLAATSAAAVAQGVPDKDFYELREYRLSSERDDAAELVDQYLREALLPALERQGIGPVGVFQPAGDEAAAARWVLIPYDSPNEIAEVAQGLANDSAYAKAAEPYLSAPPKEPVIERIRSEMLIAFDCMPKLKVPELKTAGKDRVFELRTYESASERLGNLKVEMFNSGEVPIFLDSGIQPVFFGQALVGPSMPNLTYLTVYPDWEARDAGWDNFREHPDWKKLSQVPRYKGTVSKIDRWDLVPTDYSQL